MESDSGSATPTGRLARSSRVRPKEIVKIDGEVSSKEAHIIQYHTFGHHPQDNSLMRRASLLQQPTEMRVEAGIVTT